MNKIAIASFFTTVVSLTILLTCQTNSRCLKIYETQSDLREIQKALDFYYEKNGNLPNNEMGLSALLNQTPPIIKNARQDSWWQPFVYKNNDNKKNYILYSIGKNGIDEFGSGDDITTWEKSFRDFDYGLGYQNIIYNQIPYVAACLFLLSLLILIGSVFTLVHRRFVSSNWN